LATFLNISIHLFIGLSQFLSIYGLMVFIERRQKSAGEWEEALKHNHASDLDTFLAGKGHEDIEIFSNRYMKNLSSAWKMKSRWSGKFPDIAVLIYGLIQLTLFVMLLETDFGQAWH